MRLSGMASTRLTADRWPTTKGYKTHLYIFHKFAFWVTNTKTTLTSFFWDERNASPLPSNQIKTQSKPLLIPSPPPAFSSSVPLSEKQTSHPGQ